MSDLIKRLRKAYQFAPAYCASEANLCGEAADALAARDSVIAEKERELELAMQAGREATEALAETEKSLEQAEAKLAQAMAEMERLRGAVGRGDVG